MPGKPCQEDRELDDVPWDTIGAFISWLELAIRGCRAGSAAGHGSQDSGVHGAMLTGAVTFSRVTVCRVDARRTRVRCRG